MIHIALIALSVAFHPARVIGPSAPPVVAQPCADAQTCRRLALEAAERKDFDAFHDLAWRALSAGPMTDPALMITTWSPVSMNGV